jgi:hypothetical protein
MIAGELFAAARQSPWLSKTSARGPASIGDLSVIQSNPKAPEEARILASKAKSAFR